MTPVTTVASRASSPTSSLDFNGWEVSTPGVLSLLAARCWKMVLPSILYGKEGRHGLFIMTLPFPEALGTPAEERPQSRPPPHGVYFLQIHYNASFTLEFFFSKHFPMCGLIFCYISWQPNISPSISWEFNSLTVLCHLAKFCLCYSALRKEWIWITWCCGCFLKERKLSVGTPSDCVSWDVRNPSRFSAIPLLSAFPLTI